MNPTTEAGQAWLGHFCDYGTVEQLDHILAIEKEARRQALAEVRAALYLACQHVPAPLLRDVEDAIDKLEPSDG